MGRGMAVRVARPLVGDKQMGSEAIMDAFVETLGALGRVPEAVTEFVEAAVVAGDMALPFHFPEVSQLPAWQAGFRFHALDHRSLVSELPGAWQPGWLVIALNAFDDPFFVDLHEQARGFPVYYAPHGAGRWEPLQVAAEIQGFSRRLRVLRELATDDVSVMRFLAAETDPANALWREVREARAERPAEIQAECEATWDPDDWQQGALILIAAGSRKIEVAQVLAQQLGLRSPAALTLASKRCAVVREGRRRCVRELQRRLLAVGAEVVFRSDQTASVDAGGARDVE